MTKPVEIQKVARCIPIEVQPATFEDSSAIRNATPNATSSLKALAGAVLERNTQRNTHATEAENQCNFCSEKTPEKLRTVALVIEVWTPSGTAMTIRADNAEHAAWLKQMNPKPVNPAPKPDLKVIDLEDGYE